MTDLLLGAAAVFDLKTLSFLLLGVGLGVIIGAFPGVTSTMAVALASGFTLTLEPVQGLAVLITIYVAAQFGDRIPAILMNVPGTPAAISTTFDGYPLAKLGKAGLAMTSSALGTAVGLFAGTFLLILAAQPLAKLAQNFGPPEMFALVMFGITMMVGVSGGKLAKGLASGAFGLFLATVGRDGITGEERFTFGVLELSSGVPFIPVIIGLFGLGEVLNQMLNSKQAPPRAIKNVGEWWPSRNLVKRLVKPTAVGVGTGSVIGFVPAVGGDIAGVIGWENVRKVSKNKEEFGKGSLEGLTGSDAASGATLGGSLTTTLALGVPGDSVMAVIVGSMLIWGIQPGPMLFISEPTLVGSLGTIMMVATILALAVSLVRVKAMIKLVEMPRPYIWALILAFCMIGTYSVSNSKFDVALMFLFGLVGLVMIRFDIPAGPAVLGLILGPLAELNLRRSLAIGGVETIVTSPIAMALLTIAAASLALPILQSKGLLKRKTQPQKIKATK